MNESSLTRDVMDELLMHPDVLAFKLSDNFTIGIPDIIVHHRGNIRTPDGMVSRETTWLEIKHVRENLNELKGERSFKVQLHNMQKLEMFARAAYVIFWGKTKVIRTELWAPDSLFSRFYGDQSGSPFFWQNEKVLTEISNFIRREGQWTT